MDDCEWMSFVAVSCVFPLLAALLRKEMDVGVEGRGSNDAAGVTQ